MDSVTRIIDDHIQIRLILDRLRAVAAAPLGTLSRSHWRRLLRHEVGLLSRKLVDHFDAEERGGYMRRVIERRPGLQHRVAETLEDHTTIRNALEGLVASTREDRDLDATRAMLRETIRMLAEHESAESELMQEASQRDIGVGD